METAVIKTATVTERNCAKTENKKQQQKTKQKKKKKKKQQLQNKR